MTTLTSSGGPPEVINARRTESLDAPNILKLVQPTTESLFGRVNVVNLIEKAVLAVTLSNDRDEVLGHAAFFDYPNLAQVDSAKWEEWLNKHYDTTKCTPLNSLFMHYFVARTEYSHGCAKEIIRTMFNAVPDLHYCFLVVPTGVFPDAALADVFHQLKAVDAAVVPEDCAIFACFRHQHVPVLHVRHAKVEDHDDLVPIFNRQSSMLKHTYGDYFLAELIEAEDENMKCIVAEVEGTAVGFMSISNDVNVELLNECFELGPFHGLRAPTDDDQVAAPPTPITSPVPEAESIRPSSARSNKSTSSQGSKASGTVITQDRTPAEEGEKSSVKSSSQRGSRPGSKESVKAGEEVRVKPRLSEAEGSATLSDHSDAESVRSTASIKGAEPSELTQPKTAVPQTPKPPTPRAGLPKRFIPTYKGANKAFCVQLFCIDEAYEMRSLDFLPKAFECFPDYDYCIVTVPHLVPEFPLLQQFVKPLCKLRAFTPDKQKYVDAPIGFQRVSPRCPSTLSQELYVFTRHGLLKPFKVRPACSDDYDQVTALVAELDHHENLVEDLQQYIKARRDDSGTPIQAYVAHILNKIVGIAVVRSEEDIEYIRSHYNIEDFVYFNHHRREEHGHLHHYALNPIYKHYSKHFLKEVLRQGHKTCLYYPLYPPYAEQQLLEKHSLVAALSDMVPVRARRQIDYPVEMLADFAPSERVLQTKAPYALNHINCKLTLEPKVTINARILVVGASDTGVAFLETFAFCPHLRFNNLTLVSPHGLPGELPPDTLRDQMMSSSHCYSEEDYAHMSLRTWVNVVYGKMTAIDRRRKHVIVNGSTIVPYDHLIVTTGTQYQIPAPTEADITKLLTNNEVPNSPNRRFLETPPQNVFTVNDAYDAAVALYWVENNLLSCEGKVILYGDSIDVLCCVQTLITMGVVGTRIIIVNPPQANDYIATINNVELQKAVDAALKDEGVEVLSDYLLAQWNDGNGGDVVSSASFTSSTKPMRLECVAFFAYYKKTVDYHAFRALNDACLVYDGRLVIDATFHTNDVSIRAAGSVTKFQRSYHADMWTHSNFNSKEVGVQLATSMLTLFDPTLEPEPEPPQDLLKLIPMYRSPKIKGALLPGGFHFLHVGKPSLETPLEFLMAQNDYGRELKTGTPGGELEYFRLHVNLYNSIETVTCFSKKPFPAKNIICLFGLHERFLNNLVSRFNEGLISDFYSYFSESWCLAIFHDRFPDFRDEVRELLITRPAADAAALEEKVRALIEEDLMLSKDQRQNLMDEYASSGAKRAVETRLLSFLTYNYYHLPMYAKPGMV